jgi:RNA polymerase sigma factor (sigma-70 family)
MATGRLGRVLRHLRGTLEQASDGQLLERFLADRDEVAFEVLLRRHGSMVLAVCRRVLGHVHDAEDAFQATFLILARKAATVRQRGSLGNWLYGVAHRTALQARRAAARRRAKEAGVMPRHENGPDALEGLREVLDRELERLPDKFRAPVVLCDLEGRSRKEAARQLGLPETTVASRLATARRMLAQRLKQDSLPLSGGALAVALAEEVSAAVPAPLVSSTVKAVTLVANGSVAAVATPAVTLMNEVLKTMFLTKLKVAMASAMVVVALAAGSLVYRAAAQAPSGKQEGKPLTTVEALREENELLKINLRVVLEKVRNLEEEVRKEKARADVSHTTLQALKLSRLSEPNATLGLRQLAVQQQLQGIRVNQPLGVELRLADTLRLPVNVTLPERNARVSEAVGKAEAAIKALRQAGDMEGRQRAADDLEKALKELRKQLDLPPR